MCKADLIQPARARRLLLAGAVFAAFAVAGASSAEDAVYADSVAQKICTMKCDVSADAGQCMATCLSANVSTPVASTGMVAASTPTADDLRNLAASRPSSGTSTGFVSASSETPPIIPHAQIPGPLGANVPQTTLASPLPTVATVSTTGVTTTGATSQPLVSASLSLPR